MSENKTIIVKYAEIDKVTKNSVRFQETGHEGLFGPFSNSIYVQKSAVAQLLGTAENLSDAQIEERLSGKALVLHVSLEDA